MIGLHAPILRGPDEDESIKKPLHGLIKLNRVDLLVVRPEVVSKHAAEDEEIAEEPLSNRRLLQLPSDPRCLSIEHAGFKRGARQPPEAFELGVVLVIG